MIDSESSLRAAVNMFGDDKKDSTNTHDTMGKDDVMKEDNEMKESEHDNSSMEMDKSEMNGKENIVRKGVIDVEAIDKNHDGKVFQDAMDWNVISDEPGECPECGMTLLEYTIQEAKENLKNNGFEYKK